MSDHKKVKQRNEIENSYKWNIEDMYKDAAAWEADFKAIKEQAPKFTRFAGHLSDNEETLIEALKERDAIWKLLERIYVYARMKKDEDNRVDKYQAMSDRSQGLIAETSAHMSFFTPELLEMGEEKLRKFVEYNQETKIYHHLIEDMLRQQEHVLDKDKENLLAQISEITSASNNIFSMINNADIKFGTIMDEDGDEVEITHGKYIGFLESTDRRIREDAFTNLYAAYEKQKNTLASTYNYNTKTDVVFSRIRKYDSSLQSALSGDNIPVSVYDNLIDAVNSKLPLLHRYVEVRRKVLNVDQLHMYDMYVPLVEMPKNEVKYETSLETMYKGLAPLGKQYLSDVESGVKSGWIDVYENEGKTSGAYSFGSYTSMPYILLNYTNKFKDVFTLVHEMGHSMHSYYTRRTQPYIYGSHSIFTAEVASTVNECLLMEHMIANAKSKQEKMYLINLYIEEFRGTVFRQTMFAEFEKLTHEACETGEVLTPDWLCKTYEGLNKKYFGEKVFMDSQISMEWARIPHFYNAFYVYKYATGYSAAVALSKQILTEGEPAQKRYLNFLTTGESNYPIELLKGAGVDMSTTKPILEALDAFEKLIVQIEELV